MGLGLRVRVGVNGGLGLEMGPTCCCSSRSASRREMMASSVCASEARRVSLTRRSSR